MMNTFLRLTRLAPVVLFLAATLSLAAADAAGARWSKEKAAQWYQRQPWPVGCNYIPSTAINQIETWQAESFDPRTIDRELGWAEALGFNTVRVFLHDLVWEADPAGFKKRLDQFLGLCQKHHLRAIITFFTNGCYGYQGEPHLGPQPAPTPGIHNSGWVQSPGATNVNNPAQWGRLEKYVVDVVSTFAQDDRILLWCLYNEPESTRKGAQSLPLLREVFAWARRVNPSQPLTAPIMRMPKPGATSELVRFLEENCDVLTFHCYGAPAEVEAFVKLLQSFERPLICTEYMARTRGSTFQNTLPVYQRERVGAMSFGLVAGKMNTHFPWGSKAGAPEPKVWFHDILRGDGTPFDPQEVVFLKQITGRQSK